MNPEYTGACGSRALRIGVDARNLVSPMTGISRYYLDICRGLANGGHEINLYLPSAPVGGVDLGFAAEIRIGRLRGAAGRLLWSQTQLPRWIESDRLDLFWGPAHRLPATATPSILTVHDLVWLHHPHTMRPTRQLADRILMQQALHRAAIVCTNSRSTLADVAGQFSSLADRLQVVPPAFNPDSFSRPDPSTLRRHGIDRDFLLFVGTNEPRKNLPGLIQALASLRSRMSQLPLLVVAGGSGWRMKSPTRIAETAGIAALVRETGYLDDAELTALYEKTLCLVQPSFHEGFGLPILEAQAFGVPIVASNRGAIPETAGEGAILVDPENANSLADAIANLLTDHRLRRRIGAAARRNATRFPLANSVDAMEKAFARALTNSHAAMKDAKPAKGAA